MEFSDSSVLDRIRSLYTLRAAMALQGWDQETGMPAKGYSGRSRMQEELEGLFHERICAPQWREALQAKIAVAEGDWKLCCMRAHDDALRKSRIPQELAQNLAGTASRSQHLWSEARKSGDSKAFLVELEKLVELKKQEAQYLMTPGQEPYEALLQGYEPGMTLKELDPLFDQLEKGLLDILAQLKTHGILGAPSAKFPKETFPEERQKEYLINLLPRIGFDLESGRMDRSAHPFTESIHGNDVRITVRYRTDNVLDSFFSLLHEAGHGLYEQGFAEKWHFTPLAEAVSLGVHESQSRFWENCVGRAHEFWEGEYPRLQTAFPEVLGAISLENFMQWVQKVALTPIRVESDEVTYNLHILLRYRLEKKIFSGQIRFDQIEENWNQEFKNLFGYAPASAAEGFLQDVHWSAGLFGYFPTYTLGNIWAAQIRQTLMQLYPQWSDLLRQGQFAPLLEWLRIHIHQPARRYSPADLMFQATGKPLDPQALLQYLQERYLGRR